MDVRFLRHAVGSATVVGLGESAHGSGEQFLVKHQMVRFLVEHMGFRTLAFEEDFAGGVAVDHYVLTGEGDPRQVVAGMSTPFWATEEILDLVRWMRSYNETHQDKVRFLGTDVVALRVGSFDAVADYVRRVAPDRVDELAAVLAPVRPNGSRPQHLMWYFSLPDNEKQRLVGHARSVYELVLGLPATRARLEREYVEQHARAILGWYVNYAAHGLGGERERAIADTIDWWRRVHGGKIAYWAANAHTAAAPAVTVRFPRLDLTSAFAGGYLRERLGRRYASVGTVFGSGAITSDYTRPAPHPVGPAPAGLLEATLGHAQVLDLHAPGLDWLAGPATMRMITPAYTDDDDGARYTMSVDSLRDAFDVLVHVGTTTPSRLLSLGGSGLSRAVGEEDVEQDRGDATRADA